MFGPVGSLRKLNSTGVRYYTLLFSFTNMPFPERMCLNGTIFVFVAISLKASRQTLSLFNGIHTRGVAICLGAFALVNPFNMEQRLNGCFLRDETRP